MYPINQTQSTTHRSSCTSSKGGMPGALGTSCSGWRLPLPQMQRHKAPEAMPCYDGICFPSRRPTTRILGQKNPPGLGEEMMQNSSVLRGLLFFQAFHLVCTVYLLVLKGRLSIKNGCCFLTTLTVNMEYWNVLGCADVIESCLRYAYQDPCSFHSCRWAKTPWKRRVWGFQPLPLLASDIRSILNYKLHQLDPSIQTVMNSWTKLIDMDLNFVKHDIKTQ